MGKLVHFHADGTAVEIKLDRQRITIGRRPDNDFCLPYPAVSGEHAAVVTILADSFLEDLGSTNGTLVNGTAVTKHFLRDRDEIDVGQQILIYVVDDAATLEPPPRSRKPPERRGERERPRPRTRCRRRSAPSADRISSRPRRRRRPPPPSTASAAADGDDAGTPSVPPMARRVAACPQLGAWRRQCRADARRPERRMDVEPALKVVSGAKAGPHRRAGQGRNADRARRRAGGGAAARPDEVRVVPVEGATAALASTATQVVPEGQSLAVGDILEVAGTKLEVIAAAKRTSA